jgi:chromosome partitioning protein
VSDASPSRGRAASIFGRLRGGGDGAVSPAADIDRRDDEAGPEGQPDDNSLPAGSNGSGLSPVTDAPAVESNGATTSSPVGTHAPIEPTGSTTTHDPATDPFEAGSPIVGDSVAPGYRGSSLFATPPSAPPNAAGPLTADASVDQDGSTPSPAGHAAPWSDPAPPQEIPAHEIRGDATPPRDSTVRIHPGAQSHALPRRLAIANQKGGVGKTTTAVNLGAALAELGYRVLVVDLDPQGNATTGLGVNSRNLDSSVYDVMLHDVPIEDVIEPTSLRNLFVVPATIDLAGAEIELVPAFSRELRLKRALDSVESDFDFAIIDCPPSLGLLTVNALAAAREVVVPIQCEYYALEGLGQLLRNVGMVQSNLNNELEVSTIILTMFDARTKLAEQVADEVREHFGDRVCRNVVPRTVRLSEAPSFGQPIILFDPTSRGAIAYRELAKEVGGGAPQRVG